MTNKTKDHDVHKYKRITTETGKTIYRCNFPGCTHWIFKSLILNRRTICVQCNNPAIITRKMLRNVNLKCVYCMEGIERENKLNVDDLLTKIGIIDGRLGQ